LKHIIEPNEKYYYIVQKKVFGLKRKETGATLVIIRRTNTAHKYYSKRYRMSPVPTHCCVTLSTE